MSMVFEGRARWAAGYTGVDRVETRFGAAIVPRARIPLSILRR